MSRDWEATFNSWAAAPSETERTKCGNAERAVRKAIDASTKLSLKTIEVFAQGSYANRTNVRQDSDVDICVLCNCKDTFFPNYSMSEGLTGEILGHGDAAYPYPEFKNDIEVALTSYFGKDSVTRGNKAFDIHANTYRIDADVVACCEHRRYMGKPESNYYLSGTQLIPDNGGKIINWPRQNYENGVGKNEGRHFKDGVRILKRLRNEMADNNNAVAKPIPSFLLECLAWNVPNEGFEHDAYKDDVRYVLAHLWNNTRSDETCKEWAEINELKYLFRTSQPWKRQEVNAFLQAAWDYVAFQ